MHRSASWRGVLSTLALAAVLSGQTLTISGNPFQPGGIAPVTVFNNTGASIFWTGTEFVLIRPTGEVADPRYFYNGDTVSLLGPGAAQVLSYAVPSALAGLPGSFVLLFPYGSFPVARLDIGAASPAFPAIHTFPRNVHDTFGADLVTFGTSPVADWSFYNLGGSQHSFAAGDRIDIFTPGGTTPLATVPLSGLQVPPGGPTIVPLPVSGLAPGPYTVNVTWADPAAGPTVRTFGIREAAHADLHLPAGHLIPLGGSIEAYGALSGIALGTSAAPLFAFLVGFQPGTTTLPGGSLAPLVADPLVLESFNGLSGLLSNNLGVASEIVTCFCPPGIGTYDTGPIILAHPNVPALSGFVVRAAIVVNEPVTGLFGASQPEELTLQ